MSSGSENLSASKPTSASCPAGTQPVDREGRAPSAQQQQVQPVGLVLDERDQRGPGGLAVVDVVEVVDHEHRFLALGQLEVLGHGPHEAELRALDPLAYPATRALIPAFKALDRDAAFHASVDAFIDGVSSRC